jgi:hypothetical protein
VADALDDLQPTVFRFDSVESPHRGQEGHALEDIVDNLRSAVEQSQG